MFRKLRGKKLPRGIKRSYDQPRVVAIDIISAVDNIGRRRVLKRTLVYSSPEPPHKRVRTEEPAHNRREKERPTAAASNGEAGPDKDNDDGHASKTLPKPSQKTNEPRMEKKDTSLVDVPRD